ncbi:MAG: hypothetical protein HRU17_01615 [Polyangiaceae bacterium]|nr:hypothetical protein [Polyangiaceae bacterium]
MADSSEPGAVKPRSQRFVPQLELVDMFDRTLWEIERQRHEDEISDEALNNNEAA